MLINSGAHTASRSLLYSAKEISGTGLRKDSLFGLNARFPTAGIFFHLTWLIKGNTIKSSGADLCWPVAGRQTRSANTGLSLKLLLVIRGGKFAYEVQSWLGGWAWTGAATLKCTERGSRRILLVGSRRDSPKEREVLLHSGCPVKKKQI